VDRHSRVVTFEALVYAPGTRPPAFASHHASSWIGTMETAGAGRRSTDGIRTPSAPSGTSPSDESTTTEAPASTRSAASPRSSVRVSGFVATTIAERGTGELERAVSERGGLAGLGRDATFLQRERTHLGRRPSRTPRQHDERAAVRDAGDPGIDRLVLTHGLHGVGGLAGRRRRTRDAAGVTHGFDRVQLLVERPRGPPQGVGLAGDLGEE
jgi:hypothetical protein